MTERDCDILGLGGITVDDMLYLDRYPDANTKVRINGHRRKGGGRIATALAQAARLGSRCRVLGRLGDNDLSKYVRLHLAEAGVDLSLTLHEPDAQPLHCTVVVAADEGSRTAYANYAAVQPLEPGDLRPEWFAGARMLLVDNTHPPTLLPAVRMAREAGLEIVADIERNMPQLEEIYRFVDHNVVSADFALPLTGCDTPAEACRALAARGCHRTVVVTAGPDGCYWQEAGSRTVHHAPGHSVEVVDTTGCGDVFHGVFCYGILHGWPMARVVAWANAAAAVKATRPGGWSAIPTAGDIEGQLQAPSTLANRTAMQPPQATRN